MSELSIVNEPGRRGIRVQLDGRNIEKAIQSLTVEADAVGAFAHIELPVERLDVSGDVHLLMPDETRQFLIEFGWTPPKGTAE